MDEIVKKAMAKWPDVPHCHGWLALDARGNWRMRDERAQALGLAGDKVTQAALLGFINRNYLSDAGGRWYFQNGPQRVYVNLEATPYIVRIHPPAQYVLHTGEAVSEIGGAWMTEHGQLILDCDGRIAQLEDRDMALAMPALRLAGRVPGDDELLGWLAGAAGELTLLHGASAVAVQRIEAADMERRFAFVRLPLA